MKPAILFSSLQVLIICFNQVISQPTDFSIDLPYEPEGNATVYNPKDDLKFCDIKPQECRPGSSHPEPHVACTCNKEKMIKNKCKPGHVKNVLEFRKEMLQLHNSFRNFIASGQEKNPNCGSASNMNALSYDLALEYIAMCTSIKCEMAHDLCRTTRKFKTQPGQNIYSKWVSSGELSVKDLANSSVYYWYYEIVNVTQKDHIDKFNPNLGFGHFSTMIWHSATHVGCAAAEQVTGKRRDYYLTCNYGSLSDAIDMTNRPAYVRGPPASNCERGMKPNQKYTALCGKIEPIPRGERVHHENIGKGAASFRAIMIGYLLALIMLLKMFI